MRENKASDPTVGGRHDLSVSGSYRAPYKSESVIMGIVIGVVVTLVILIFILMTMYVRENYKNNDSDRFLLLVSAVIVFLAETMAVNVGIVLVRFVRSGYQCSFMADEERFITNEGGNSRVIFFSDVQAVFFTPRTIFSRTIYGYEVTVKLNGRDEVYCVASDGYISEKSTPFYIIVERVEKLRRAEARKRYDEELAKLGSKVSVSLAQPESGRSAPSSRIGQDALMPSVSLDALPAAGPKASEPSRKRETFIADDGREVSAGDILGIGKITLVFDLRKTLKLIAIPAAVMALLYFISYVKFRSAVLLLLGIPLIWIIGFIILRGEDCSYRANGREFVVTNKKGGEIRIEYLNAQSVNYLKTLLGYKAEILTSYGIVTFNCIDSRKKIYETPEKLPFNIIAKNIKK